MSENTVYDTIAEEKMIRQKDNDDNDEHSQSVSQIAEIERGDITEKEVRDAQTWG